MATRIASASLLAYFPGQPGHDPVEQVSGSVAVKRGDGAGVTEAKAMELERIRVAAGIVDLVGNEDHGFARPAENGGDLLVTRSHTRPRISDEHDEVGLLHSPAGLFRDLPRDW